MHDPLPSSPFPDAASSHVVAWAAESARVQRDALAVEEPLEIRLAGGSVAVTMRTPGHDADLALGFLYTEGIIHGRADVHSVAHCLTDDPLAQGNIINVNPVDPAIVDPSRWQRNFYTTSSCGVCGKASIDAVRLHTPPLNADLTVTPALLYRLPARLEAAQRLFGQTGGLHAAGLFDATGTLVTLREDVGRHNAVDKVIGDALRRNALPLDRHVLLVSGRASFEIVQKALMARIPIVAAISAPSSLAVDLARSVGMTLVGFLRPAGDSGRFNLYTAPQRIVP